MYGDTPPDEVLRLVAQIARALEQAHMESAVHRDL
jgi:serine/threonine protein kinase